MDCLQRKHCYCRKTIREHEGVQHEEAKCCICGDRRVTSCVVCSAEEWRVHRLSEGAMFSEGSR